MLTAKVRGKSNSHILIMGAALFGLFFASILGIGLLNIDVSQASGDSWDHVWKRPELYSQTAKAAFKACHNESNDDLWIAVGNCSNLSGAEERAECLIESKTENTETREHCRDQLKARLELCNEIAEAPYDPKMNPDL